MSNTQQKLITLSDERIINQIYLIRRVKVMFDRDLAELYGVATKVLNQAVKRNIQRFPRDFMFQLSPEEFENLKSQFVTSSWGGVRKLPLAFTEQGVAMLSSVLKSNQAIQVNIQIIRAFTKMRQLLATHEQLRQKIEAMERNYDQKFARIFRVMKYLLQQEEAQKELPEKPAIGFRTN